MHCKPFDNHFIFLSQRRPVVVVSDQKSSTEFIYSNKSQHCLSKYKIDGCLIADCGAKCDFLLLNCENKHAYFIELKGSDLIKAVDQVERSINILSANLVEFIVNVRIVLTRVNTIDLRNSKYLRLEKKIIQLGGTLKKQSRQMTEVN